QAYRAAGLSYRPRNGPFQSVDELMLVMDMTATLFKRMEPALTVYSGRQFIDPQVAPREVLLAMPGADQAAVDVVVRQRNQGASGGNVQPTVRGRAFAIRVEFAKPYEGHAQTVTVRLTDDEVQPYWVLNWRAK